MPHRPLEFNVDTWLTNFGQGFDLGETDSVAYRVFTPVPVQLQTGKYKIWNRGDWLRDQVRVRPLGGEAEVVFYGTTDGTYSTQEYILGYRLDDRERANNAIQAPLDQNAARLLLKQHQIKRDRIFSTAAMTTGVWGLDVTGVAGTPSANQVKQWNDAAATPYDDIEVQRERMWLATGHRPNVLVLGVAAWNILKRHPQLTGYLGDASPKILTRQQLIDYFEVDDIVIPRSVYNSALEGATDNIAYTINTKSALLVHRAATATPDMSVRTAGAIFGWNGLLPGQTNADGTVMGWLRRPEAYSDQLDARAAWAMKVTDAALGTYFTTVVA